MNKERKKSLWWVTHGLGVARAAADEIIFMNEGRIAEFPTPEKYFSDPSEASSQAFLSQLLARESSFSNRTPTQKQIKDF